MNRSSEHPTAPYLIGLTGNIATGKSTVAGTLAELGAETIDADKVAHEVMAPGAAAYDDVVGAFGEGILREDGSIDRKALGAIVFEDPEALARLESLVHPAVIEEVAARVAASDAPAVVVEAIKLLESGMAEEYDAIWVTTCPRQEQVRRLVEERGLSREEAMRRIEAQPPQSQKIARADVVINTAGTFGESREQVRAVWAETVPPKER
jgi:dephospho-CoA kinase